MSPWRIAVEERDCSVLSNDELLEGVADTAQMMKLESVQKDEKLRETVASWHSQLIHQVNARLEGTEHVKYVFALPPGVSDNLHYKDFATDASARRYAHSQFCEFAFRNGHKIYPVGEKSE